jgi:(1->4)-alpha-D-glucan 1-alpha-D-glucosylmutase
MPPTVPIATYRLQFTPDFGFDDAAAIVPYLKTLGISHVYASPFLKARAGSTHGYDVIDHRELNPELGGEAGFAGFSAAIKQAGLGLILDFVPNHMAVHYADNAWWLDVLEWGPKSPFAPFFDIEWDTLPGQPRGGVLLPILGSSYGDALEKGELELRYDAREGSFSVWYFEHRLPIGPSRYGEILDKVVATARAADEPAGRQFMAIAQRYRGPRNPPRDKAPALKAEIAAVEGGAELIARGLKAYQPKSQEPGAVLVLHHLLERQYYRPAQWRLAGTEINYRRFFDINNLAGLRVEDMRCFDAIHGLAARLIANDDIQGLRLDHIDGLRDPQQYCRRLQSLIRSARPQNRQSFYVVIEKILAEGEPLPNFSGVAGTTGYEWLNVISRLLLNGDGLPALEQCWRETSGDGRPFGEILIRAKRRVLANILASEFTVLTRLLARIAAGHYSTRDYTTERLRAAFESYVLHFPVYRTYMTASGPSGADRAIIGATIDKARATWFGSDRDIFDFLREALTLDLVAPGRSGHSLSRVRRFARKVQQFTGPMMAKSLEDTAFYRYHRLLALNEVGGDPAASNLPVADFHARMQERNQKFPHGLTATATHDTKRGEDARMRILAIADIADEWEDAVRNWRRLNAPLITASGGTRLPTAAHEYMLYQALIGAWPLEGIDPSFIERMQAYAVKSAREGKEQTAWLAPDERYESELSTFLQRMLDRGQSAEFIGAFDALARRAALIGALNSLVQLTLKATMPGVPDFYQGTELWDLSLVDPDNRRPVDFAAREAILHTGADDVDWNALAQNWSDGRIKLALTRQLLAVRQQSEQVFTDGAYQPLEIVGQHSEEAVAFARTSGREAVIVVAAHRFGRATDKGRGWPAPEAWSETALVLKDFSTPRSVLSPHQAAIGAEPALSELFHRLPLAVLRAERMHAPSRRKTAGTLAPVA